MAQPGQRMKPEDIKKLSDQCKAEWEAMNEVEKNAWRTQSESKKLTDFVERHGSSPLPLDDHRTFDSWVGRGCSARPIPIDAIADELSSSVKDEGMQLLMTIRHCK